MGLFQLFKRLLNPFLKSGKTDSDPYETEIIPNGDILFRRVHFNNVDRNTKLPGTNAFGDCNLSCDWSKYSNPTQSRELIGKEKHIKKGTLKNPKHFFICELNVSEIRNSLQDDEVRHDPLFNLIEEFGKPNNQSHSLVVSSDQQDKERVKTRYKLSQISKWVLFEESEYDRLISP